MDFITGTCQNPWCCTSCIFPLNTQDCFDWPDDGAVAVQVMSYKKHTDFITGFEYQVKESALVAVSGDGTMSIHDLKACKYR